MNGPKLPSELERLERELARRPRPEPSAGLRDRVMRAVEAELGRAEPCRAEPPRMRAHGWLGFAVAAAATVLIWMNLSMSAASATRYEMSVPAEPHTMDETARQLRDLLPEISEQEARRYAVILRGGAELIPCADVALNLPTRNRIVTLDDLLPQGE